MHVLDYLSLKTKLLLPLALLFTIFAATCLSAMQSLSSITTQSTQIIQKIDPAIALLTHENLLIQGMGYDVYRVLSYQTNTPEENAAVARFGATAAEGSAIFDQATALCPAQATAIGALRAQFASIEAQLDTQEAVAVTTNGFTLGSHDTPADEDVSAGVARNLIGIDSAIDSFSHNLQAFTATLQTEDVAASRHLNSSSHSSIQRMIITTAAAMATGLLLFIYITGTRIVAPIKALSALMERLASGDLSGPITLAERQDEIGLMARAVKIFQRNAIAARQQEAQAATLRETAARDREAAAALQAARAHEQEQVVTALGQGLEKLAAGDLETRQTQPFPTSYERLRENFNSAATRLRDSMANIRASSQTVHRGAEELAQAAKDLASRTERAAAALVESNATLGEINSSLRESAAFAQSAREAVAAAQYDAEHSGGIVEETVNAMTGIETSSRQIGSIIGVIDEIAFQTNLLALNAGVEAARAGDSGRGFAVVATEVRALAQRSAAAAKEIKSLIEQSDHQVAAGVKRVGETGAALRHIATQVAGISAQVRQIAAATQTQEGQIQEVHSRITEIDHLTQQNGALAGQAQEASQMLSNEAETLANLLDKFKVDAPQRRFTGAKQRQKEVAFP